MVFSSIKKNKILITGKNSRFCKFLKEDLEDFKTIFTSKKEFDILNFSQMDKFLRDKKIKYLIHIAGYQGQWQYMRKK